MYSIDWAHLIISISALPPPPYGHVQDIFSSDGVELYSMYKTNLQTRAWYRDAV